MSDRADYLLSLVLSEDRMPAMQAKWADKLNTSHDTRLTLSNDQHVRAKAALSHIERMDPTPNKQYTGKLIDWYHKGQFRAEDAGRVSTAVSDFHSLKNRLKPEHAGPEVANPKDFSSYPSIHHLERALKAAGPKDETPWTKTTASQRDEVSKGSKVVHDDDKLTVRQVDTHKAMKVLGSNTSWCVVPDKDTFDEYREQGPLYHIHEKKTGARKLIHFGSDQFMDENDEEVDHADYGDQYPALKKLFHGKSYDKFNSPEEMEHRIKSGQKVDPGVLSAAAHRSRDPETLHTIATSEAAADHWTKLSLLGNPKTAAKSVEHLHATVGQDHQYDRSIAAHPNTPSHVLDKVVDHHLGNFPQTHAIMRSAMENKNVRPETLERVHKAFTKDLDASPSPPYDETRGLLKSIAGNQRTPQHVLSDLLVRSDKVAPHLRRMDSQSLFSTVLNNPNTHASDLRAALKMGINNRTAPPDGRDHYSDATTMRAVLSRHPNADADLLSTLHTNAQSTGGTDMAIAAHPNTPTHILASQIGNTKAHMHMAGNPKLSHDLMHKLVDYEVPHSKEAFYQAPHDHLNALFNLAKNPSAPTDVLHKLHGKAKELGIRVAQHGTTTQIENKLAEHPNADTHLLQKLSRGSLHRDNPAARRLTSMGVEPQW